MNYHPYRHHCTHYYGPHWFLDTCQLPQTAGPSLESRPDRHEVQGEEMCTLPPFHSSFEAMLSIFLALPTTHCLGVQNLLIGSSLAPLASFSGSDS